MVYIYFFWRGEALEPFPSHESDANLNSYFSKQLGNKSVPSKLH